jgi:serine/threonine protein kinase
MIATIGRYEVERLLGRGGLGSVYLAYDPVIGRQLAIKVIPLSAGDSGLAQRILREAQVLGRLLHPNIVAIYDVGQLEDFAYIVMQYVDGKTLQQLIAPQNLITRATFREVLSSVSEALDYAHRVGVVHRDIKPSNIMVSNSGDVKVMDFGIAHVMHSDRVTDRGFVVGSIGFISPEQINGKDPAPASDQFSLAVVSYLTMTGKHPFEADTAAATVVRILHEKPEDPRQFNPTLSSEVAGVFYKALSKLPEGRYHSCADFAHALLKACDQQVWWAIQPTLRSNPAVANGFSSAASPVNEPTTNHVGEFTRMFQSLAAGPNATSETNVPRVFPEPRTTFFKAGNTRFEKIEESIKFYRDNLTGEYTALTKQAELTYRLWLCCVGIGFLLLATGIVLMFTTDLAKGAVTASSTILIYFIQKVFHQREDYYRNAADSKSKHLQYGNQWLLVIQSIDAIENADERVRRQTALVDVLTDRLRSDKKR